MLAVVAFCWAACLEVTYIRSYWRLGDVHVNPCFNQQDVCIKVILGCAVGALALVMCIGYYVFCHGGGLHVRGNAAGI
jgi:hypothetical protein